jgi:hypothetical protein
MSYFITVTIVNGPHYLGEHDSSFFLAEMASIDDSVK